MILLQDLFNQLGSGEFSNIALKRDRDGTLDESEYGKVIGHINLGLVEIYKRFQLQENEIVLHAIPEQIQYELRDERTAPLNLINSRDYIEVSADHDGFLNIIEITKIYDADGKNIKLNNRFLTPCVRQVSDDTLKITGLDVATTFNIVYQAHPSPIVLDDDFDPAECWIAIPKTIIEALLYYVAMRVYKPMGQNNSTVNADKSASYQQQYELSCQKLDLYGLIIDDNDDDIDSFSRDGWV